MSRAMTHEKWLQIIRDGRPLTQIARAHKRTATGISAIKRGYRYQEWYAALVASGENPVLPVSLEPEPPREPHWSITQPWGQPWRQRA